MAWESEARNRVENRRTEMFSSNGQDGQDGRDGRDGHDGHDGHDGQDGRDGQETHKAFRCRGAIYRARGVCIAKTLRYACWLEYPRWIPKEFAKVGALMKHRNLHNNRIQKAGA